jgi:hypothetical protein
MVGVACMQQEQGQHRLRGLQQKAAEAVRGNSRPSEAIRGHPRPSEALTCACSAKAARCSKV